WLQQNCTRFGFIYRYQKETEAITHIAWEPWHYRYVGANHAEVIAERGVTLEEYIEASRMG
ncbi:MAG: D-alanyl-D-alanine carboxypeptidase family protein, partial [Oscillospiraceae bacterium]